MEAGLFGVGQDCGEKVFLDRPVPYRSVTNVLEERAIKCRDLNSGGSRNYVPKEVG
jgi:hypothetical protein